MLCVHVCLPPFQEVAEPLQDLKEGMEQLEKNKTLRYILSTLLSFGNFLNNANVSSDHCKVTVVGTNLMFPLFCAALIGSNYRDSQ